MTVSLKSQTVTLEFGWGYTPSDAISTVSWTDVSTDLREADGVTITRGRTDETSTPVFTIAFTLSNPSGRYTPGYQPSTNWPNVVRGVPVRFSQNGHVRYVGWVDTITPDWSDASATDPICSITAAGRIQQMLNQPSLGTTMQVVAMQSNPTHYYALDEADTATALLDSSGYGRPPLPIPPTWTMGQSPDDLPKGIAYAPSIAAPADYSPLYPLNVQLNGHAPGVYVGTHMSAMSVAFKVTTGTVFSGVYPFTITDSNSCTWQLSTIYTDGSGLRLTVTPPGSGVGYSYDSGELADWRTYKDGFYHTAIIAITDGINVGSAAHADLWMDGVRMLNTAIVPWTGTAPSSFIAPTFTSAIVGDSAGVGAFLSLAHFAVYGALNVNANTENTLDEALDGLDGQTIAERLQSLVGYTVETR